MIVHENAVDASLHACLAVLAVGQVMALLTLAAAIETSAGQG